MKKYLCLLITPILMSSLLSCAGRIPTERITKPTDVNIVSLPDTIKGKPPDSYEVNGIRYYPLPDSYGYVEIGQASWYGSKFHGNPTASGEIYNMYDKSAAHKTLPLGTYVSVLNLSNNKEVVVKINDRGPFIKGRIIDLSYSAAKELDLVGPGIIDVKVTALGKEIGRTLSNDRNATLIEANELEKGEFTIQVGAFLQIENAVNLTNRLKVIFDYADIQRYNDAEQGTIYRVHVSKSKTLSQASELEKRLEEMGFREAFIVRL
ncbi:MAG: septal ring lytic transglycosylase RlpA family protein [Deltaproteobacteria bacterium]|nr:septal ring lytic transglycosylase RlpA family protein [Deltaproteobacteria bacterium]